LDLSVKEKENSGFERERKQQKQGGFGLESSRDTLSFDMGGPNFEAGNKTKKKKGAQREETGNLPIGGCGHCAKIKENNETVRRGGSSFDRKKKVRNLDPGVGENTHLKDIRHQEKGSLPLREGREGGNRKKRRKFVGMLKESPKSLHRERER